MLAGTVPRDLLFFANLHFYPSVPWAVPPMAIYLWFYWSYLKGAGPPSSTALRRCESLRAKTLPGRIWMLSLIAGGLGIVALVFALRLASRVVMLPPQPMPDLSGVPRFTTATLLLASAPIAGL